MRIFIQNDNYPDTLYLEFKMINLDKNDTIAQAKQRMAERGIEVRL
jgi:hypothetical protein